MNYDIKNIIATFEQKGVDNTHNNPFAMLNLNENGHTKMLLSFLAYRDINGRYPVLQSFLSSFAKGRDKMIHYKRPSNVELQFSPCLDTDHIDGLITFEAGGKKHAVIIENKIFDVISSHLRFADKDFFQYRTYEENGHQIGKDHMS